jgi:hypothetical protein
MRYNDRGSTLLTPDMLLRQFHPLLTVTIGLPNIYVMSPSHLLLCLPNDRFPPGFPKKILYAILAYFIRDAYPISMPERVLYGGDCKT